MKSIQEYWNMLQAWVGIRQPAVKSNVESAVPSSYEIRAAHANVEAASASLMNAYREYSTVTMVEHSGGAYLVGSAHATNNRFQNSKGFDYRGRKLFLVIKNNRVALAEHVAVNLQGSVCDVAGNFSSKEPFQEVSLLKLLGKQETEDALYELSFGRDSGPRLKSALNAYPALAFARNVMPMPKQGWTRLTEDFSLRPLRLLFAESSYQKTPEVYSIAHHNDSPHRVVSQYVDGGEHYGVRLKFPCETPIVGGHSGSLVFRVVGAGGVVPVGIIAATDGQNRLAYATPYAEVMRGFQEMLRGDIARREKTSIDYICADLKTSNAWYAPEAIAASSMVKPEDTPSQNRPTVPKCR